VAQVKAHNTLKRNPS